MLKVVRLRKLLGMIQRNTLKEGVALRAMGCCIFSHPLDVGKNLQNQKRMNGRNSLYFNRAIP
jgi:hypothetical protein